MLQKVTVAFDQLDLEVVGRCQFDTVALFDGPSNDSLEYGKFCRGPILTVFTSSGSSLLVVFQTDGAANSGRFSLVWTFAELGKFVSYVYN